MESHVNSLNFEIIKNILIFEQLTHVINFAGGYCNTLQYLSTVLATLDVLVSFAIVAASAPTPYIRPKMLPSGTGTLNLKQARHPCVEMQDSVSYIPNSINFKQDSATLYLITGPNMGGKSTYIRSIGVVALLAHIGSFVPCDEAEIPILDAILARVGANDSQIKGMSTFMVEMVETSSIIRVSWLKLRYYHCIVFFNNIFLFSRERLVIH